MRGPGQMPVAVGTLAAQEGIW